MFDSDGHFIDDPLLVVTTKPDFSNLGLEPIHIPITLKDIIGDVPYWIKFLPHDWKGLATRANIKIAASKMALKNTKFDARYFVSQKLVIALKHLMKKHGWSEISLTDEFGVNIDAMREPDRTYFTFHIEFALS